MADMLNMERLNALPHPLWSDDDWPIYDIDVETGLFRIDVCGMLQPRRFGELLYLRDADGVKHAPDRFYIEE